MSFINYYNQKVNSSAKKNVLQVQELAKKILNGIENSETKKLIKKVTNRIKRWGSSSCVNDVIKKITEDYDFAMEYAKPPTKQNLSEKVQYDYLKNRGYDLKKLPTSGENSMRFKNGEIVYGDKEKNADTKSFDFLFKENIYTYNKLTTTGFDDVDKSLTNGGGQKNQFEDGVKFLKQALLYTEKYDDDKKFVLIVDGDYYTNDKIDLLKNYTNKRVKVTNSDEFEG